jgi:hypothetical protein
MARLIQVARTSGATTINAAATIPAGVEKAHRGTGTAGPAVVTGWRNKYRIPALAD